MNLVIKCLAMLYCIGAGNASTKERFSHQREAHHVLVTSSLIEQPAKFHLIDRPGVDGTTDPILAEAHFADEIPELGWAVLSIKTTAYFPDIHQAYWAGYLETYTSYNLTRAYWDTVYGDLCPKPWSEDCSKLEVHLVKNLNYIISNAINLAPDDTFWHQIELLLWQTKGVADAFEGRFISSADQLNSNYLQTLREDAMGSYLLQAGGDLEILIAALGLESLRSAKDQYGGKQSRFAPSCSAIIKLAPDNKDVFISHTTWNSYKSMLRVIKHYELNWRLDPKDDYKRVAASSMSFSSYPSQLSSWDDFYVLSSGMVVTETTNDLYNTNLYSLIRKAWKRSLPESFRCMAANRLATDGRKWVEHFSRQNSGTYNNHWMIFDVNRFDAKHGSIDNFTLVVAEEMPGIIESADMTDVLKQQTYWASYNIPYFKNIHNISGYSDEMAKHGDTFSYERAPRARIFARDHLNVSKLAHVCKLIGSNNFRTDPLSACDCKPPYTAQNAIAARCDLNDPNGTYPLEEFGYRLHGAIDFKATNLELISHMSFVARSGPTSDQQPAFDWSRLPVKVPKPPMQPSLWNFPTVKVSRRWGVSAHQLILTPVN